MQMNCSWFVQKGTQIRDSVSELWLLIIMFLIIGASSTVAQTCSITATGGNYGSVDILAGLSVDTASTLSISCTGLPLFTVRTCVDIGPGTEIDASGNRVLRNGTNDLRHELYTTAARSTIWGSWGTGAVAAYTPNPAGVQQDIALNLFGSGTANLTVYGRLLAGQSTKPPGTYTWTTATPGIQYGYLGGGCPAGAKTALSSGMTWTATLAANCTVSATNVAFGSIGVLTSAANATGSVTARCTSTSPYNIGLSAGTGTGATVAIRKMTSGANTVTYSLYRDAGMTSIWGNTIGTDTQSATGTAVDQVHSVYARIPAQTTPPNGTYTDTIVATVTY